MTIEIRQTFQVAAPLEAVWAFMMSPENVVACMPGASLQQVLDATRFLGAVKVRVGAVTARYQGTITYVEADRATGTVKMLAEGNERGGGTVRGTIVTELASAAGGTATTVECRASVDLTGRIVQVGRGMIEGVSTQIIRTYVANVRGMLESPANPQGEAPAGAAGDAGQGAGVRSPAAPAAVPLRRQESINIVAVVMRTLWERLRNSCRRLFRRV